MNILWVYLWITKPEKYPKFAALQAGGLIRSIEWLIER